jgi:hypothetical protein
MQRYILLLLEYHHQAFIAGGLSSDSERLSSAGTAGFAGHLDFVDSIDFADFADSAEWSCCTEGSWWQSIDDTVVLRAWWGWKLRNKKVGLET